LLPDSVALGRLVNEWMFRRHVRRITRSLGITQPMLWLNPHSAVHMAGRMQEAGVIYDITDDWTCLDQSAAAGRRTRAQDGALVFIGPAFLSEAERARLTATGRVHLVGAVPYMQLPAYMRAMDVCIMPHRMTAFTESLNPIKLWEYLAAGKPIVSTDVAGFRD